MLQILVSPYLPAKLKISVFQSTRLVELAAAPRIGCALPAARIEIMPKKPKPHEIKKAANRVGLDLTDDQARLLSDGVVLPLADMNVTSSAAAGKSEGIKLTSIGTECGIYLVPWPPQVRVCCES